MAPVNAAKSLKQWHRQTLDGGILAFDRVSGTNVLLRNAATTSLHRRAPRVLQIGLLARCNMHCEFCYRDTEAPDRLDAPFLLDLLRRAADWGVLEVAFGGGEPLMYSGLLDLLQQLHEDTPLGLNLTTNGTLLTQQLVAQLTEIVGEIRISAYRNNRYRRTLRLLVGQNAGVNWLVTSANVGLIELYVRDSFALGARNVLLLGYKGSDASLHLRPAHFETLNRTVLKLQHLPLRLDACWYPLLPDVPHLFPKADCGAGDEFLVITPDRAVQPCSFHADRIPFESFEDLKAIYERFRSQRPASSVAGCTRRLFSTAVSEVPAQTPAVWVWQARASNNSGDWTIVGRFQTAERAQEAAKSLRELARAHEAFLASPEGHQWLEKNDYMGNIPSPPLRIFGELHGFDWTGKSDGLWWEGDGFDAPVLTAGAVGSSIVVYHPYCMGLPEHPFKEFFARVGATEFGYWQYDRPAIVVSAKGSNAAAIGALGEYLALVDAAEYPSDVNTPPPWGSKCEDPRILGDEDGTTRLAPGRRELHQEGNQLRMVLAFENTFAGSLALENWLAAMGYEEIEIEIDDILEGIPATSSLTTTPKSGLFGDVRPLEERLEGASSQKVVELVFGYHSDLPTKLAEALKEIPPALRLKLCQTYWERSRESGQDVTWQALLIIQNLGPIAAGWTRHIWQDLIAANRNYAGFATQALAASLPPDEAFDLAKAWAEKATERETRKTRLMAFGNLAHPRTLEFVESWWESADPDLPVTEEWGRLAADSRLSWTKAEAWLRQGRPLSLIALDAMLNYLSRPGYHRVTLPVDFGLHSIHAFQDALSQYSDRDSSPRVVRTVRQLIENARSFVT
jgi:hypothetical protein